MRSKREANLQTAFICWLSAQHKEVRKTSYAIPNGGSRHRIEAYNLKTQGVTAGVPDVFIGVGGELYNGLYIEFKVDGNKPTTLQKDMMSNLTKRNYKCVVCYTLDEAIKEVNTYLKEVGFNEKDTKG